MGEKYLYGASVQGIQGFIFQTNKLRDIAGASKLVDDVCSTTFDEFAKDGESIVRAAGNVKHAFNTKEECEKAVRDFPRKVMEMAPGITVSQAVVKMIGDDFENAVNKLEGLLKIQRNKPVITQPIGLMAIERARNTGLPAHEWCEGDYVDLPTYKKRKIEENPLSDLYENFTGQKLSVKQMAHDIEKIPSKNDWIAIVHADGNGVGKMVMKVGKDEDRLKEFSENLTKATIEACQGAFQAIDERYKLTAETIMPIRPVVLGGDDLTFICRADLAVPFIEKYLKCFEEKTEELLPNKLTACAGIAFIKSSYPFYYGYDLAEKLCGQAKKAARVINSELAPSCLQFHKVQDSFVEDYKTIVERELTTAHGYSFEFGPYFSNNQSNYWTINDLTKMVEKLDATDEGKAVKSHLRQWVTLMHDDQGKAEQKINRLKSQLDDISTKLSKLYRIEELTNQGNKKSPVYDILSLYTIQYQETNKEDNQTENK